MPDYNKFVFDEIRRIGKAWIDTNPGEHDIEQLFEKIGDMSWRRLVDNKSMKQIFEEIGVNPEGYGEPPDPPTPDPPIPSPINIPALQKQPRYGLSIASLLVNTQCNIEETLKRFIDAGANSTRINLLSALWAGVDCLPYNLTLDGKWDLFSWNTEYFERLQKIKELFNSAGINIQWTNYELYSWSKRKSGVQQNNTPWRNNINGVSWKEDDSTFQVLPDEWSKEWFKEICPLLGLDYNIFEIGNEFPEKALHERVRDYVRSIIPNALIQVNRNEDTPGQYTNMKIGKNYNFISFHGNKLKELNDLNRVYNKEPDYKTFQQFINKCPHEKGRVTFSSDGARISSDSTNTYDWEKLGEFFQHMKNLGYGIEHQSRAKMTPAPNHHMIEIDWFKKVIK